jgi:hypothetical protein
MEKKEAHNGNHSDTKGSVVMGLGLTEREHHLVG